jgi:L-ribulose-5-phosphate 3-epimerase UlaE
MTGRKQLKDVRFEVSTAVTMNNTVFWDVTHVALVMTDVSEELSASFIRVTRIGELGTTLAVTSNRRTLRRDMSHGGGDTFFRNVGSYKSNTA